MEQLKCVWKYKIAVFFLVVLMMLGIGSVKAEASTGGHSADDAINWVKSQVGKGLDYDGVAGNQCVDLICYYYSYLGQTSPGGNGADYTWNALPSGWQRIQGAQPQKGDILVYTGGYNNYGHVAIYAADRETYHQNFDSHSYVEKITYMYNGLSTPYWGVIRPDWGSSSQPANNFTSVSSSEITETSARLDATTSLTYITECGYRIGTNVNNMNIAEREYPYSNTLNIWYTASNLTPGVTYYYQFYYVSGGNTVWSEVKSFTTNSIKATGISLNKTSLQMVVGDTENLSATITPSNATNKTVYWDSSNLSVVSIVNGVVTAKAPGTAVIYARAAGASTNIEATCTVTVVQAPTISGVKIGGRASDALRLNWNKSSNASGYIIEQYKNGAWTRIARIASNSTTTYRVEGLSASTTYQFRVRAFGFNGSTPIYSSYAYINGKTNPGAVTGLKIGGTAKDALRLNWNKNSGASGYIIEQYKNGAWTWIARIANNSTVTYRVEGLSASTTYKFRVQAFGYDGSTALYSTYQTISGTTSAASTVKAPSAVTGLKIGGRATDALRLNWDKNSSASGYIIEQYKNGAWTRIARIASNSTVTYRVEGLSASTTYQFRVQAFGFNGSTPLYSAYKNISGTTLPSAVTGLKIGGTAKDALRLNWNKNAKASGYIIEQYKNGSWVRIARIGDCSTVTYRVEGLSAATTYQFRIQAFGFDGSTALYSAYQYVSGITNK